MIFTALGWLPLCRTFLVQFCRIRQTNRTIRLPCGKERSDVLANNYGSIISHPLKWIFTDCPLWPSIKYIEEVNHAICSLVTASALFRMIGLWPLHCGRSGSVGMAPLKVGDQRPPPPHSNVISFFCSFWKFCGKSFSYTACIFGTLGMEQRISFGNETIFFCWKHKKCQADNKGQQKMPRKIQDQNW